MDFSFLKGKSNISIKNKIYWRGFYWSVVERFGFKFFFFLCLGVNIDFSFLKIFR